MCLRDQHDGHAGHAASHVLKGYKIFDPVAFSEGIDSDLAAKFLILGKCIKNMLL